MDKCIQVTQKIDHLPALIDVAEIKVVEANDESCSIILKDGKSIRTTDLYDNIITTLRSFGCEIRVV